MSFSLQDLIEARFTYIAVDTQDVHIVPDVLADLFPMYTFKKFVLTTDGKREKEDDADPKGKRVVYYHLANTEPSLERSARLSADQKTVILINYEGSNPLVHYYGALGTPVKMIARTLLSSCTEEERKVILKAIAGLSYTHSKQLIRLAESKGVKKTYAEYNHLRSSLYGMSDGIYTVDVSGSIYQPAPDLNSWFEVNRAFMFNSVTGLSPRGVLLHGEGGTGKTEFAKYASHSLNVPLYRLDIGSSLSRWQGESEANIRACLKFVDENAPCILLIDEVEKAIPKSSSEESSARILGHLLWWLAEHQSQVFTVMTVNDKSVLPKELYREGRCDAVFELSAITSAVDRVAIATKWLNNWHENNPRVSKALITAVSESAFKDLQRVPMTPAAIINSCKDKLRNALASEQKA